MEKIRIAFPDGTEHAYDSGITAIEIVSRDIGEGLARAAVAAKLDSASIDLNQPITTSGTLTILTFKDAEGKAVFWHSAAHVLAQAVKRIHTKAKLTIGPAIEEGFYYDFDASDFSFFENLERIEAEMKKIVDEDLRFERKEVSREEAIAIEKKQHEPYKVEMINELPKGETITLYRHGEFTDLCRGPHVPSTGRIKAFKLTKLSGAYWRGNTNNTMLQRVYGIAFPERKDLKEYLAKKEEAEKRDHRRLGKEMDLFSFHEEGPGFPFFHPKGMVIWNELIRYWEEEHKRDGYVQVKTPIMLNRALWERSGHWANYRENMYTTTIDEQDFAIKPMNCPGGMLLYREKLHSYRELPMRVGEIGLVHRHELSGVLAGLFRVRSFHQDDAHIFMTEEQIKGEILGVLNLIDRIYSTFGFKYHLELSTRPEKSIGSDEAWETATDGLRNALDSTGREYKINEGDGAFYGPKIDVHVKDAIGRTWQCATIQLDMNLPERFDLTYEGADGQKHRPVMIHRVIYGALERFMGILIEHYAGKFPLWLSPVQVKVLAISDKHAGYVTEVVQRMQDAGVRAEADLRSETINYKVRDAQLAKINYICVCGDKEVQDGTVTVRTRENQVTGAKKTDAFISSLLDEIKSRK